MLAYRCLDIFSLIWA
uniref:Uncharacterized protein n=1 Tax=Lepeophtheirus salmonis TaxID=72036 RepID=A0A0K2TNF8_LEPSM